jgi:phage shock protein A
MYKQKKKRAVDPNAPPRPNLLTHEKKFKETISVLDRLEQETKRLQNRIDALESKLSNQTTYLNQLHQYISSRNSK